MENIHCLVISFKQLPEEPEYIYFVSDRPIEKGNYYINAAESNFMKVSYMRTQPLTNRCRRIEATNNPKYLLAALSGNIQSIPKSFTEAYMASGKTIKTAPLRVNTNK